MNKAFNWFIFVAIAILITVMATIASFTPRFGEQYKDVGTYLLAAAALPLIAVAYRIWVTRSWLPIVGWVACFAVYSLIFGNKFSFSEMIVDTTKKTAFILYLIGIGYALIMMTAYIFITWNLDLGFESQKSTKNALNTNMT